MRNFPSCTLLTIALMAVFLTASISKAESFRTTADSSCPSSPATPGYDDTEGFGINSVAFSPNGKFILAGGAGQAAFLWDAYTGALLHCFVGHRRTVENVEFAPDGKTVLTSAWDTSARLWDTNSGALLHIFPNDTTLDDSPAAAYSPDGAIVFTMAADGTAILWDVQTGLKLHSVAEPENNSDGNVFAFSPDSKLLATANKSHDIARIWDVHSGTLLRILQGDFPDTGIWNLAFSPDSKTILTGDQEVIKWDVQTGTRLQIWQVFKTVPRVSNGSAIGVLSIKYLPDGKTVMTDGDEGPILWDAASGRRLRILKDIKCPSGVVCGTGFISPDGRTLAHWDYGKATLWDAESGTLLKTLTLLPAQPSVGNYQCYACQILEASTIQPSQTPDISRFYRVNAIAFSPDGKTLLTGSQDDITRVWDVQSGKLLLSLKSPI